MEHPSPHPPPPSLPSPPPPPSAATAGFTNERVELSEVPVLDDQAFTPVDPRYRTAWLSGFGVAAGLTLIVGGVVAALIDSPVVPIAIAAAVLAVIVVLAGYTVLEVRRLGYQLREHDVSYRDGVITHRVSTVPFVRVQHVSVRRGAFERMLGLATVDVNSAGPDISIPGLAVDDAERIKQLITERAGVDDSEPSHS